MIHRSKLIAAALSLVALAAAPVSALAAAPAHKGTDSCFRSSDWNNWRSPSPSVIYLNVRMHDVYRVDLAAPSNRLDDVGVHLVSVVRGSDMICSPSELRLAITDTSGLKTALIAKSITRLTPDEVAAIPAKFRP